LEVDGSFITEVHIVALVGGKKRKAANSQVSTAGRALPLTLRHLPPPLQVATASFWASELSEFNTGWRVVNGSCGGGGFSLGMGEKRRCEEPAPSRGTLAVGTEYPFTRMAVNRSSR